MKYLIPFAAIYNLRISRHQRHARLLARPTHRHHHPLQVLDRQSLFQNKRRRQKHRRRSTHRQIIDGAIHRQGSNIPTRKK